MKKLISILVAFAMMAALAVTTAFAADPAPTGTADSAKLVKYLDLDDGVVANNSLVFNFTFTNEANAQDVVTTSIPYTGMTNNIGTKAISAIFANYTFPAAGEYIFDVAETAATHATWDADNETITEDTATYKVHLYVKNTDNGLAIDKVTVEDAQGNKVDPTDVDPTDGTKGFSFTNVYTKELKDDNTGDNTGLIDVTKTVSGDYGDKTFEFSFELNYELPDNDPNAVVKYKVLEDGTGEAAATEQTATGGKIAVTLKHGDKLIITQAPQGLKWNTEELWTTAATTGLQNADKYQTTANGTEGRTTAQAVLSTTGAAAYVNTLENDDITPTGILMNNLPYIALALIAIGGLVAYVVVRRRNADEA